MHDFDKIEKVAIGGMAEIYRARQKLLERSVAIKKIRPELASNPDIRARFSREAKAAGNLLHQNLAHVYDYRESDEGEYIVMEFIDGFDLAQVIHRQGALPIDVALMISVRILNGLSFVHAHGMVHRDIKPDNIRITTRGEVKIMDFGIALDSFESSLTQPGVLVGSPHYLSPEQIEGSKIDFRADLFSFGITLYEMLTGRKPFFESEGESVYQKIRKGDYLSMLTLRPDIPAFVVDVVDRCLKQKPRDRPRSTELLQKSIEGFVVNSFKAHSEPRIVQYFMEVGFMEGDPQAVDLQERTLVPVSNKKWSWKFWSDKKSFLQFVLLLIGALVLVDWMLYRGTALMQSINEKSQQEE